jgi:hypothetical protein
MRRCAGLAIALALCANRAPAQDLGAGADTTHATAAASLPPAPGELRPSVSDSSRVFAMQSLGALADSLTAKMARLAAVRPRLAPDDRQVFDELVAAAREMADDGDLEGAALVVEDARQLVSKKAR